MTLYTFFNNYEGKVVYGTVVGGKTFFFFSGFTSAEEAKQATFEWHYNYALRQLKPNQQGLIRPKSVVAAEVSCCLNGEWSEIE